MSKPPFSIFDKYSSIDCLEQVKQCFVRRPLFKIPRSIRDQRLPEWTVDLVSSIDGSLLASLSANERFSFPKADS